MSTETHSRPPLPPFSFDAAVAKVRMAENAWNTRDPERVSLAYTPDCRWRNRCEFINGRTQIVAFLTQKWEVELEYRLIKQIWAHSDARIAVRFAYEWRHASDQWYRSYGNENWEFDAHGLMRSRHTSINDLAIRPEDRKFEWPSGPRPEDHPGLSKLGL